MIEKIDDLLRKKGMSQAALERSALLSANRISKWKDEKGEPTGRQALRIARLLDVPVEYLLDDDMEEPPALERLSPAEERAVEMVRALGLGVQDVIRGLSSVAGRGDQRQDVLQGSRGIRGHEVPVDPSEGRKKGAG